MAISTANSSFTFSNSPLKSNPSLQPIPTSVKYTRPRISAAYATSERTSMVTDTVTSCFSSLYDVLGVGIGADTNEVKAAYRRLARVLHPDVRNCDSSADEFMKVHSAYTTLSDPVKRADYDRTLFQKRTRGLSAGGYRGRRWETDQCW